MTPTPTRVLLTAWTMSWVAFVSALPAVAAEAAGKDPVKVFILAGQSNMEGHGIVEADPQRNAGAGSLEHFVKQPNTAQCFRRVARPDGGWVVRDDAWIGYRGRWGNLTVGYGARDTFIGPEFSFGHVMADHFEAPVVLIKTAWGGKSLAVDFRPPSSGKITFPVGKLLGEKLQAEPKIVGKYYRDMLVQVREVLGTLGSKLPDGKSCGYEIAGFGWHQGWNDGCNADYVAEYERNLANLVRDLRKDLGVEKLPVVIATSGFGGWENTNQRRLGIMNAQLAVAKYPEFQGNVAAVDTRDFFRPPEASPSRAGYHWNHNAETHMLIGDAMGRAMIDLLGQ